MVTNIAIDAYADILYQYIDRYLPFVEDWYNRFYEHIFDAVGSFSAAGVPDELRGLYVRFCMSDKHSAVRGLQAFMFLQVNEMNLPQAHGGVRNMVNNVLGRGEWSAYRGFYMIVKKSLVHIANAGQFIIIIPEEFYNKLPRGRFVWLTETEQQEILHTGLSKTFTGKIRSIDSKLKSGGKIQTVAALPQRYSVEE